VVVGAKITATNRDTRVETITRSNQDGNYIISTLKEGPYDGRAEAPGFKQFVMENLILEHATSGA